MRTEEDLRDAFDHLADQAPDPSEIRAALLPRTARRSRRTGPIIATALATACAAVAAVVVPHIVSQSAPAAQEKRNTAWSRWVDLNLPKNIEAVGQWFTANRQDYDLYEAVQLTWPSYCRLQLHRNGDFDPASIPAASPTIDVNGRKARVVTSLGLKPFMPGPQSGRFPILAKVGKTLAWQPVDGVWALLSCESQRHLGTVEVPVLDGPVDADLGMATGIAKAFSAPTRPLGSPFKLGSVPSGLSAREVKYQPFESGVPGSGEEFTALLSDGNAATGYVTPMRKPTRLVSGNVWDPAPGDDLSIRYDTSKFWNQMTTIRGGKADLIINGMKAYYTPSSVVYSKKDPSKVTLSGGVNTLRLEANGVAVVLTSYAAKPSMEALVQVAESMDLTRSPKNPATWFDTATALP